MIAHDSPIRRQLLISVQSAREARLAQSLGVPWIDLKNPALGSLGCPDVATAREVVGALAASRHAAVCQTSVALGELRTLDTEAASELMQLFPIAKVGLAGLDGELAAPGPNAPATRSPTSFGAQMLRALDQLAERQRSAGQLVLAAYADYQRAAAPTPEQVVELAARIGARFVLVDTFVKDGLGLFHWKTAREIAALGGLAQSIGAQLVVAGSLSTTDWPALGEAAPAIVGVRGGVCTDGRTSELCPHRIAQWLQWAQG